MSHVRKSLINGKGKVIQHMRLPTIISSHSAAIYLASWLIIASRT